MWRARAKKTAPSGRSRVQCKATARPKKCRRGSREGACLDPTSFLLSYLLSRAPTDQSQEVRGQEPSSTEWASQSQETGRDCNQGANKVTSTAPKWKELITSKSTRGTSLNRYEFPRTIPEITVSTSGVEPKQSMFSFLKHYLNDYNAQPSLKSMTL